MAPHGGTLHRLVGGWRQPALPIQGRKSQPARRVAACRAINLRRLVNLGLTCKRGKWKLQLA